jgi:hypothetical protein
MLNNSGFFMKRIMVYAFLVAFATVGSCFASYDGSLTVEASFDLIKEILKIDIDGIDYIKLDFSNDIKFVNSIYTLHGTDLKNNISVINTMPKLKNFSKSFFLLFNGYINLLTRVHFGKKNIDITKGEFVAVLDDFFQLDQIKYDTSIYDTSIDDDRLKRRGEKTLLDFK